MQDVDRVRHVQVQRLRSGILRGVALAERRVKRARYLVTRLCCHTECSADRRNDTIDVA